MEPLSGAASVIAVLSLAVQVGDSVYKLSKLLKSIRDAPKDLELLNNDLDRLRQILARVALVAETQKGLPGLPAPSADLFPALEEVEKRVKNLEDYASILVANLQGKGVRKVLFPLRMSIQKDTLHKFRKEISQSREDLNTVLLLNSTQILIGQSNQIQKLLPPTSFPGPSITSLPCTSELQDGIIHSSPASHQNSIGISKHGWYGTSKNVSYGTVLGLFGYCITYSQYCFSERGKRGQKNANSLQAHNWSFIFFLWFINRYLEIYSRAYCGQVERRWRICPVDPGRLSPVWRLCKKGDTRGVLKMFNQGVSPYLKDEKGRSLLNAASAGRHTDLCRVLIQQNVSLCIYGDGKADLARRLVDISLKGHDIQSSYDFVHMIISHDQDLADGFTMAFVEYLIYFNDQECVVWWPRERLSTSYSSRVPTDALSVMLKIGQNVMREYFEDDLFGVHKDALKNALKQMGSTEFDIKYGKNLWLLNILFTVDAVHFKQEKIWDLEAASEDLGRQLCSLLSECGINAQGFIDSMMDYNDGGEVYLRMQGFGASRVGRRRLMRGKFTPLSLRWEWNPPLEDYFYLVFEEFGQFYSKNLEFSGNGNKVWGWPFSYERNLHGMSASSYIQRQDKSLKRAKRKGKKDRRFKSIPGAFPD